MTRAHRSGSDFPVLGGEGIAPHGTSRDPVGVWLNLTRIGERGDRIHPLHRRFLLPSAHGLRWMPTMRGETHGRRGVPVV
jgi:hypothetical protein